MSTVIILLVLLALIVGAVLLVRLAAREQGDQDPLEARLHEFVAAGGQVRSIDEFEMQQSFTERVLVPLGRQLGEFLSRFTPQKALLAAERDLVRAGLRGKMDPTLLLSLRFALAVAFLFLGFFLGRSAASETFRRMSLVMAVGFAVLGYYLPVLWIRSRIQRRKKIIQKALPDVLDLISVCVSAGLGFDGALQQVVEKWSNEVSVEFGRVLREMQLGKTRREALRDLAERVDLPELTSFVAAVIQAEQLGVGLTKVLRIQADGMRLKRRQRAEEEARKAPIKMLFPLAFLIMPALFIVLLGPAVFILMQSALGSILFGG
ncbi:MAG: type II secretion system F family protein [Chloroflexi bacterium]|nr:type II secretion system F family protein [Chloroflexota bacterium]